MQRPYANFLGISIETDAVTGDPTCIMSVGHQVAGAGGSLHGGALAGLLETAAGAIAETVIDDPAVQVQPVSITVDYLRPGRLVETRAHGEIVRRGERIIHVDATAWQDDPKRPVAMARLVFSIPHERPERSG